MHQQQHATTTHPNETFQNANEYDEIRNESTEYTYAYSHVRGNHVSSTQPVSDITRVTDQSDQGWADNIAYNTHGDDGLTNHNADRVVVPPSNLPAQNQTNETDGWAENVAYARHQGDVSGSQNDEGWMDNTVYVEN